jgi:predicted transglutaminase-like cysteine proteinase
VHLRPEINGSQKCLALVPLILIASIACAQAVADLGFTSKVTAALTVQYARKFGASVPDRFTQWLAFAKEQKSTPYSRSLENAKGREAETLQIVNDAINKQMKWVDDKAHWGVDDYWATPAESSGSAGGDCEDFSIAKYYLLKELGVPLSRLRITYVRVLNQGGQAHMILTYYARPDAEPLIMDNIDARVRPASQRSDLEPVYSFNDDEVQVVQGKVRGKPSQIRAWLTLQERLVAETRI